jgi:nucleoside-diphosphate-sugar epimerase
VGSEVTRELLQHEHRVLGNVRNPGATEYLRSIGAEPILGNLAETGDWQSRVAEADAIVDASQSRVPGRLTLARANRAAMERVRFTTNLLEAVSKSPRKLQTYVSMSGLEDYVATGEEWLDERTSITTDPHGHARIGLRVRPLLLRAREEWDLPLVELRMGLIYGTAGWFRDYCERLRHGRFAIVGTGTNYNSFSSVTDVAQATRLAIEKRSARSSFLVVDDEPTEQRTWVADLAGFLGRPPPHSRLPTWLASWVVGRVNVETFASSRKGRNERMKQELGVVLRYPTYRQGLPKYLGTLGFGPPEASRQDLQPHNLHS